MSLVITNNFNIHKVSIQSVLSPHAVHRETFFANLLQFIVFFYVIPLFGEGFNFILQLQHDQVTRFCDSQPYTVACCTNITVCCCTTGL